MKMKISATLMLSIALVFITSCSPKETSKAENFSFVFEESSCGYLPWLNILDTSTGMLIHTPLDETESIEIPVVLSEGEMEMIYQEIISSDFWITRLKFVFVMRLPHQHFALK